LLSLAKRLTQPLLLPNSATVGGVSFPAENGWPIGGIAADRYIEISTEADPGYGLNVRGITFGIRLVGSIEGNAGCG